jgi:hypothetical protein
MPRSVDTTCTCAATTHEPGQAGRLSAELTSFVGRNIEVRQLKGLLPVARLVTLTGIGGRGKTRLAVRTASELRRTFADGVMAGRSLLLRDASRAGHVVAHELGLLD